MASLSHSGEGLWAGHSLNIINNKMTDINIFMRIKIAIVFIEYLHQNVSNDKYSY